MPSVKYYVAIKNHHVEENYMMSAYNRFSQNS